MKDKKTDTDDFNECTTKFAQLLAMLIDEKVLKNQTHKEINDRDNND